MTVFTAPNLPIEVGTPILTGGVTAAHFIAAMQAALALSTQVEEKSSGADYLEIGPTAGATYDGWRVFLGVGAAPGDYTHHDGTTTHSSPAVGASGGAATIMATFAPNGGNAASPADWKTAGVGNHPYAGRTHIGFVHQGILTSLAAVAIHCLGKDAVALMWKTSNWGGGHYGAIACPYETEDSTSPGNLIWGCVTSGQNPFATNQLQTAAPAGGFYTLWNQGSSAVQGYSLIYNPANGLTDLFRVNRVGLYSSLQVGGTMGSPGPQVTARGRLIPAQIQINRGSDSPYALVGYARQLAIAPKGLANAPMPGAGEAGVKGVVFSSSDATPQESLAWIQAG